MVSFFVKLGFFDDFVFLKKLLSLKTMCNISDVSLTSEFYFILNNLVESYSFYSSWFQKHYIRHSDYNSYNQSTR